MFVSGVPGRCEGFVPVHFGNTVRKNTMSIEFGYDKDQQVTVMIIFITLILTCFARQPVRETCLY